MRFAVLLVAIGLSSCASTKLPNTRTAAEQFSVLGAREKAVARNFYDLGQATRFGGSTGHREPVNSTTAQQTRSQLQIFSGSMSCCPCRNTSNRTERSRKQATR
jgi:hypothetical protein